jgi:hypothetical protein
MTTTNTHPIELALIGALAVLWALLELSKALVALVLLLARWKPSGEPLATCVSLEPEAREPIPVAYVESTAAAKPKRAPRATKARTRNNTPTPAAA